MVALSKESSDGGSTPPNSTTQRVFPYRGYEFVIGPEGLLSINLPNHFGR